MLAQALLSRSVAAVAFALTLGAIYGAIVFGVAACGGGSTSMSNSDPGPAGAVTITTQPESQTVAAGQSATFSVIATGAAPLTYQWQRNGAAISGATSASYTTPAVTLSDSGAKFTVAVSNSTGSATS